MAELLFQATRPETLLVGPLAILYTPGNNPLLCY